MTLTLEQYQRARYYLALRALRANKNESPTASEALLYQECFAYQQEHKDKDVP